MGLLLHEVTLLHEQLRLLALQELQLLLQRVQCWVVIHISHLLSCQHQFFRSLSQCSQLVCNLLKPLLLEFEVQMFGVDTFFIRHADVQNWLFQGVAVHAGKAKTTILPAALNKSTELSDYREANS